MSKKFAICLNLLFCGAIGQAQHLSNDTNSDGHRFEVDEIKGCAPFTVTLSNLLPGNCTPGAPCAMDFEGTGQQVQNTFSFIYTSPGTYKLSVLYQSIGADDITITVDENIVPDFEIYSCNNSDVTIKVINKDYDQFVIDFTNDGIPETIIPSGNNATAFHNYAAAGGQVINVRGRNLNSADNCAANVQNFTALNILPAPTINTLTAVNATTLDLEFTTQQHIQYRLEIAVNNSSTFQLLKTFIDETSTSVPNLKVDDNYYCFRLSAFDVCTGTPAAASTTICSQNFDLNIASAVNELSWTTSTSSIQSIEIERDNTPYTIIPGAPLSFNDIDIECKTTYCYRVISNYAGGAKSTSLQKCGEAFRTSIPALISNTSAIVGSQGVTLDWIQEPPAMPINYTVLRSVDGQTFGAIANSPGLSFEDSGYTNESNFYYRIDYVDECDNKSPIGGTIHPIRLLGTMDNKNVISLTWNEYEGYATGVNRYVVEKFNKDGTLLQSFNNGSAIIRIDDEPDPNNQVVTYRIRAIAAQNGLTASISNEITFTKDNNLFFPTAFSPNGDNLNDGFIIKGQFIVKMEFTIFNRWGELIYITDKNEPWNGTRAGKPVQVDAYVWSAQITDLAGRTFKEAGTVALMRPKK